MELFGRAILPQQKGYAMEILIISLLVPGILVLLGLFAMMWMLAKDALGR
jgi:hypothetical protein